MAPASVPGVPARTDRVGRSALLVVLPFSRAARALVRSCVVPAASARCGGQPWRCLWRRFSQITMTRP